MNADATPRRIILCADDFGLSEGVNRAILALIARRRINATSVMTVAPAFNRAQTQALQHTAQAANCQIGLHVTLTAPFRPLTMHFRGLQADTFRPLVRMLSASVLRRLDRDSLHAEVAAQIAAFNAAFGRAPDYVDGHQHVHAFPQIREAVLDAITAAAPKAWIRQCGRARAATQRTADVKSAILDLVSSGLRRRATEAGVAFNPAFAGAYDFSKQPDFAVLFDQFLDGLPDGGLVMCHPGFVDDTLVALDPLTTQREREYEFLASAQFPTVLAARNMTLA